MSAVDSAISAGLATIRKMTGNQVTYSDGIHTCTIPLAGIGKTEYEIEENGAIVAKWVSRDYFINAADIVLNGIQTLPAKGHTLTETINGTPKTFTVLAPDGQQLYEFSDRAQTQLRIHTKQTA